MEEGKFLEKLADILDCDEELTLDMKLDGIDEWDSLGIITFLAEMEKYAASQIKAADIKAAEKVSDLYALLG